MIKELSKCFQETIADYNRRFSWESENWRTRYNEWDGRDVSGKKLNVVNGRKPFPWLGASDSAPPIIDSYIREDVDMAMEALAGARIEAQPVEISDMTQGNSGTTVLGWLVNSQMSGLEKEQELCANILFETGKVAVGITWERQVSLTTEEFDIEDFSGLEVVNKFAETEIASKIILDTAREEEAIELAQRLYQAEAADRIGEALPALKKSIAKECIKDLREKGSASIPMPTVSINRPRVCAYRYGYDIFRPMESMHIQEDSKIFCREFITEDKLENGALSYEWDEAWIAAVKEGAKGMSIAPSTTMLSTQASTSFNGSNNNTAGANMRNAYEIVHAYERKTDEMGISHIVYTVFCPHAQHDSRGEEIYGKSEILTYSHGKYPFEDEATEVWSRSLHEARGYGEVLGTCQRQIKVEWDSRVDRAAMTTLPPFTYPHGRKPEEWGPGVSIASMRSDSYKFMDIPSYDRVSEVVEISAFRAMNRWLGRADETSDPVYTSLRKQRMVKRWLGLWKRVYTQCFQLCQQFMDEEVYIRVTGDPYSKARKITRDEIQGAFDVNITFNALSFDNEVRKQNLEYLERILGWDTAGVIDRSAAVMLGMQIIDPQMGKIIVRPEAAASEQEITDTKNVYARMFAGLREDVKPGQNYKLRKQVMQQIIMGQEEDGSPSNPAALQRMKTDEKFAENVQTYMKQLDFQLQQQENAMIGRRGA